MHQATKFQLSIFTILLCTLTMNAQFDTYPIYNGSDLGVTYTKSKTSFKVWAPSAEAVVLRIYADGHISKQMSETNMMKAQDGTWTVSIEGDQKDKYYTYQTRIKGAWRNEVPDIYAKAVGVNGKRGMIIDLAKTNPKNWEKDLSPSFGEMKDAVLYELHVRDATIFTKSKYKGKYLGLTDTKLKNDKGLTAGLAHIKELGVTHVHLLPVYDYYTVDESIKDNPQYNWGYDPLNYNVPEGGYSTEAFKGEVRIKEFKKMVQTFHSNGLNVIMDVVYNHTMFGEESYFNQLVPEYYYRQNKEGGYSNASGCGNETASDRPMFRKFMIESLIHWVKEYHIDGFRFDLMAIHDIQTMNDIAKALRAIKPNIVLYGEGWTSGESPLPEANRALKKYASKLSDIAVFCDDIRDAAKGSVFKHDDTGFVSGKLGQEESIKFGLVGAGNHPEVVYSKVNYSNAPITNKPFQIISYSECHDNHTLWDRFNNSVPNASEEEKIRMQMLSIGIVLTSQGIPFIHAGQEFCRTKNGDENSFKSSNEINGINWNRKTQFEKVSNFTKQLIAIRKQHPGFRLGKESLVQKHVSFPFTADGMIVMRIEAAPNDSWKDIYVVYNGSQKSLSLMGMMDSKSNLKLCSVELTAQEKEMKQIKGQSFMIFAVD